jgi:hypothetical protein
MDSYRSCEAGIGSLRQNDGSAISALRGTEESASITGQRRWVEQYDQGHRTAGRELNGGPPGLGAAAANQHQVPEIYTG